MRSILLHVHRDAGFEGRLQAALDIVRQVDGHLTCLQPVQWDIAMPGDVYGTLSAEMVPVVTEAAARLRKEVEARLAREDVRWDWIEEPGLSDSLLVAQAALADLVVLGAEPPQPGQRPPSPLAGAVAIHARSPLLVVPSDCRTCSLSGPAMVAWNGSPEASRALKAAVPFLARASRVWLVTVADPDEVADDGSRFDLPPTRGAEYLARHGIACEMVELPMGEGGVGATLAEAAAVREVGYIVMGAYGHARAMELLFGGVTRRMLTDPAVPLLLAH